MSSANLPTDRRVRRARPLFVGGTSSNSGKSWMVTAVCAWLRRRGLRVAPFKGQNMSNHSFPCAAGGEIGRAQVAQAEACGLEPEVAMNPILLKPNADGTSQVVVHGRVWKTLTPREYYRHFAELLPKVLEAYESLASRFDVVIIEGAGSVSERNLQSTDLVNLGLAVRIDAPWVLVADIERGGVFASVVGTSELLTPEERALFRGFIVNKFRGDASLFDEGRAWLEQRIATPCLGVFPHVEGVEVDAEDSLALRTRPTSAPPPRASAAIVQWPHLSNGTDFRLLTWADWVTRPVDRQYDFVFLPGTKDTMADLAWLRSMALDRWVLNQHARGATIVGVCGGFQVLGQSLADPDGLESVRGVVPGLGLLPIETTMRFEKVTARRRATTPAGLEFDAYEIHLGVTTALAPLPPFALLDGGQSEGIRGERVIGTYLHGALEHAGVLSEILGVEVSGMPADEHVYSVLADWFDRYAIHPESWLPCSP